MGMTVESELLRIKDLEANIKDLRQILERENARLEALQEECNHDIEVYYSKKFRGYTVSEIYNCIINKSNSIARRNPNITKNELYDKLKRFANKFFFGAVKGK